LAEAAPPIDVPRPLRDASLLRSGIFFGVLADLVALAAGFAASSPISFA